MKTSIRSVGRAIMGILTAVQVDACSMFTASPRRDPALTAAWTAWERGDLAASSARGAALVAHPETADAGHYLLALVSHVSGEYADAIAHYGHIDAKYPWLDQLDEAILWSYIHLKDLRGAKAFLDKRPLGSHRVTRARLALAAERPLAVEIESVVEIAYTNDALSPFMPGFPTRLNGRPAVARLDTGGSFIHLSSELAAAHGIETVTCETDFAGLAWGEVCYGVADLEIGLIRLINVPVAVHKGVLPVRQIADHFGVSLGPIIGTNVLQQFLSTVDGPHRRLILSRRGDAAARAEHLGRLAGKPSEIPFAMWGDHFMIVHGSVGRHTGLNMFVDTGLVAMTPDQGQAALLASRSSVASWGVAPPQPDRLADIPGPLTVGSASRERPTALIVPDKQWGDMGGWGGIKVDALVSWGFLRHFTWTIDFDRHVYMFMRE